MGRKYSSVGDQTVASPTDTAWTLQSTTALRPAIYDILFGFTSSPADNAMQWIVQRFDTDDGTGTAVTPTPIRDGDPAASVTVQDNHTTEPSSYISGEILLHVAHNQRSSYRWVASPGGELISAAIATEGVGIQPVHASATPEALVTVHHEE